MQRFKQRPPCLSSACSCRRRPISTLFARPFTRQANVPSPTMPPGDLLTTSWKPPLQIWIPAGSEPICVPAATSRIRVHLRLFYLKRSSLHILMSTLSEDQAKSYAADTYIVSNQHRSRCVDSWGRRALSHIVLTDPSNQFVCATLMYLESQYESTSGDKCIILGQYLSKTSQCTSLRLGSIVIRNFNHSLHDSLTE